MKWTDVMSHYTPHEQLVSENPLDDLARKRVLALAKGKVQNLAESNPQMGDVTTPPFDRRKKSAFRVFAAVAATLAAGAFGVLGALRLAPALTSLFQGDSTPLGVQSIQKTVEQNGYKLTWEQATGDSHTTYLLFSLEGPADKPLPKLIGFDRLQYDLSRSSGGATMQDLPDENLADNKKSFLVVIEREKGIQGFSLPIALENLMSYGEQGDTALLQRGVWQFQEKIAFRTHEKHWKKQVPIYTSKGSLTVQSVILSPVSLRLTCNGEAASAYDAPDGAGDSTDWQVLVYFRDGTVISGDQLFMSGTSADGKRVEKHWNFSKIMQPENAVKMEINGTSILLE